MSTIRRTTLDVNTTGDRALPQPPNDTISCMSWSPVNNHLAVSSWDNSVRIYEVAPTGDAQPRAMYEHEQVCLSCAWWPDGTKVISGGGDNAVRSYDLATGQQVQIGGHDALVTGVAIVDVGQPMVASVSYDKTLKYWNLQSQQPVATVQLPDRASHVVSAKKFMAVICVNKQALIFNLDNPSTVFKTLETSLKMPTESVAAMPEGTGLSQATAEGRCDVHHLNPVTPDLTFKCHRKINSASGKPDEVFNVGSVNFHPTFGTLLTAGADGTLSMWDPAKRARLSVIKTDKSEAITATSFNAQGTLLAYATGYDWSKGFQYNTADHVPTVKIHVVQEWEVKPKPK